MIINKPHTFVQSPREKLDYVIDYSAWMSKSDSIDDFSVVILNNTTGDEQTPLEYELIDQNSNKIIFYLSGGENDFNYKIRVSMETTNGLIKETVMYLTIREN